MLSESTKAFEADLDNTLNENIGAALGSPVKFTKIKNNAKKYQQALVQVAINNLDFEKNVWVFDYKVSVDNQEEVIVEWKRPHEIY